MPILPTIDEQAAETSGPAAAIDRARVSRPLTSQHGEPLDDVNCPLCGDSARILVYEAKDLLYGKPGTYPVVRCATCTLTYVSPRPVLTALFDHYPSDYISYSSSEDSPAVIRPFIRNMERGTARRRIKSIERVCGRLCPETQIVDVGCGLNHLLEEIKRTRGAVGYGVDVDERMVQRSLSRSMPAIKSRFTEANLESGRFDLVTMMEYLEHDPFPMESLREARRISRKDGHLAIEIPHVAGLPARLFGKYWANLDVPRHLVYFDRNTLGLALRESGFELESFTTFGIPFLIGISILFAMGWHGRMHRRLALTELLTGFLGAPFIPALPWLHEFAFVVARAN